MNDTFRFTCFRIPLSKRPILAARDYGLAIGHPFEIVDRTVVSAKFNAPLVRVPS
jgi:hypothetical protein